MNARGLLILPALWLATYCTELREICPPWIYYPPCRCETLHLLFKKSGYMKCEWVKDVQVLEDVFRKQQHPFRLTYINLGGCVMDYVPYEEAIRTTRLSSMTVEHCELQRLFGNLPSASDLQELKLKKVKIQHGFDWKLLSNFKLKVLEVEDTVVKSVDAAFERYFDPRGLEKFLLDDSKTRIHLSAAFAKFVKVRDLRLIRLALKEVPRDWFPRPWNSIKYLILRNNEILELSADFFDDMPNLEYLNLDNNNLTTLSFPNPERMTKIHLSGNSIFCNCDLKWVLKVTGKRIVMGQCELPIELHKKKLHQLQPKDFDYCR